MSAKICRYEPRGWFVGDNKFSYISPRPAQRATRSAHCYDCFHRDIRLRRLILVALLHLVFLLLALAVAQRLNVSMWITMIWFVATSILTPGLILFTRFLWGYKLPHLTSRVDYAYGLPLFAKPTLEMEEKCSGRLFHL